jgi:hypothetical protein
MRNELYLTSKVAYDDSSLPSYVLDAGKFLPAPARKREDRTSQ